MKLEGLTEQFREAAATPDRVKRVVAQGLTEQFQKATATPDRVKRVVAQGLTEQFQERQPQLGSSYSALLWFNEQFQRNRSPRRKLS